ncbi:unnamed protein product [Boreogadus saida]
MENILLRLPLLNQICSHRSQRAPQNASRSPGSGRRVERRPRSEQGYSGNTTSVLQPGPISAAPLPAEGVHCVLWTFFWGAADGQALENHRKPHTDQGHPSGLSFLSDSMSHCDPWTLGRGSGTRGPTPGSVETGPESWGRGPGTRGGPISQVPGTRAAPPPKTPIVLSHYCGTSSELALSLSSLSPLISLLEAGSSDRQPDSLPPPPRPPLNPSEDLKIQPCVGLI